MLQIGQDVTVLEIANYLGDNALESMQDVRIKILHDDRSKGLAWHAHEEAQLMWVTSGCASMETSAGRWLVPAGRMGWFPGREPHRGRVITPVTGFSLYLRCNWLDYPTVFEGSELCQALLKSLTQKVPSDVSQRRLAALGDEIKAAKPLSVGLPLPYSERLKALCETIATSPALAPPLELAATQVALSRRSFSRHFKQQTGLSYGQWLQLARIHHSLVLLGEGGRVSDAALAVGYDTVSAFCQVFRQVMGQSPGHWQNLNQTV